MAGRGRDLTSLLETIDVILTVARCLCDHRRQVNVDLQPVIDQVLRQSRWMMQQVNGGLVEVAVRGRGESDEATTPVSSSGSDSNHPSRTVTDVVATASDGSKKRSHASAAKTVAKKPKTEQSSGRWPGTSKSRSDASTDCVKNEAE